MPCLLCRFDSPFKSKKIWLTNCKSEKLTSSLTSNTGWETNCNSATMANLKCRPLTPVWWSMDQQHLRNDHRRNIGSLERILQQICQLLELDEPGSILVRTYTSSIRFFHTGPSFSYSQLCETYIGLTRGIEMSHYKHKAYPRSCTAGNFGEFVIARVSSPAHGTVCGRCLQHYFHWRTKLDSFQVCSLHTVYNSVICANYYIIC